MVFSLAYPKKLAKPFCSLTQWFLCDICNDKMARKAPRPKILEEGRSLNTLADRDKGTSAPRGDHVMLREATFIGGAHWGNFL